MSAAALTPRPAYCVDRDFVDDVFGPHVETAENGDWINVYANYDLRENRVLDMLEIVLHRGNGEDQLLAYRLGNNEKNAILENIDAYGVEQTGQGLSSLRNEWLEWDGLEIVQHL